jgi:hypothetical protein
MQIMECMREFNIDLLHLQPVKIAFIKCDIAQTGKIYAKDLIKTL